MIDWLIDLIGNLNAIILIALKYEWWEFTRLCLIYLMKVMTILAKYLSMNFFMI